MKATHTNYLHPKHLRVEHHEKDGSGGVWCVSPSSSIYAKLNKSNLPSWRAERWAEMAKQNPRLLDYERLSDRSA